MHIELFGKKWTVCISESEDEVRAYYQDEDAILDEITYTCQEFEETEDYRIPEILEIDHDLWQRAFDALADEISQECNIDRAELDDAAHLDVLAPYLRYRR